LRFHLYKVADAFLQKEILFFADLRVGIDVGQEIAVTLRETSGDGTKREIMFETIEDSVISERGVLDNLAVIRSLFGDPAFEFDHEPRVFDQDFANLAGGGGYVVEVFAGEVRKGINIGGTAPLVVIALRLILLLAVVLLLSVSRKTAEEGQGSGAEKMQR